MNVSLFSCRFIVFTCIVNLVCVYTRAIWRMNNYVRNRFQSYNRNHTNNIGTSFLYEPSRKNLNGNILFSLRIVLRHIHLVHLFFRSNVLFLLFFSSLVFIHLFVYLAMQFTYIFHSYSDECRRNTHISVNNQRQMIPCIHYKDKRISCFPFSFYLLLLCSHQQWSGEIALFLLFFAIKFSGLVQSLTRNFVQTVEKQTILEKSQCCWSSVLCKQCTHTHTHRNRQKLRQT